MLFKYVVPNILKKQKVTETVSKTKKYCLLSIGFVIGSISEVLVAIVDLPAACWITAVKFLHKQIPHQITNTSL